MLLLALPVPIYRYFTIWLCHVEIGTDLAGVHLLKHVTIIQRCLAQEN